MSTRCASDPCYYCSHRRNSGFRIKPPGEKQPTPVMLGACSSLDCGDHALAFQPREAAFESLKIITIGRPARTVFRDCALVRGIGRPSNELVALQELNQF
jgi:hypothetical protein